MPVRSMTGYGAGTFALGSVDYRVELRSVNHRHLDLKPRLSRDLGPVEMRVREAVSERLHRGHVDVNIGPRSGARPAPEIEVDEALAGRVRATLEGLRTTLDIEAPVTLPDVLRVDGVLTTSVPEYDKDTLWAAILPGLEDALAEMLASRGGEGERLAADLETRLSAVATLGEEIRAAEAEAVSDYQDRVRTRVNELLRRDDPSWREQRLEAELALLAEKADIAEELTRVAAHVEAMRALIRANDDEACGRKLEFYAIELNREFNTMAAKSVSAAITHRAVEAKAEVERIREQVANVE